MTRKTLLTALTALTLAVSLTACGGETSQTTVITPVAPTVAPVSSQAPAGETPVEPSTYVFQTGDCTIAIDQDMAEVLTALGEPQSYFEAASCAFEGLDKTYTYGGFQVLTRPDGDKDYVNSILLTDDSVTTPEGLYIGASKEDVTAVYGEGESLGSGIMYTKENVTLSFILENDAVISIEYLPA